MDKIRKAVFLDRDGTINEDINYLDTPEKLKLLPYVKEALKILQKNFLLIIISNQSGVARGYFTENVLKKINSKLENILGKEGIVISKSYYCPHYKQSNIEKYAINCNCRKPKPGMIYRAVKEFNINIEKSFLIGDKVIDVETGINAGIPLSILVKTGQGRNLTKSLSESKNLRICENLLEAANLISEGV